MRTFLAAALATAFAAAPLTAPADTLVHSVNFRTVIRQTRPFVSAGEVRGVLHLNFYKSGIVTGTYRDEDGSNYMDVSGGRRNREVWFSSNGMRFVGSIHALDVLKGSISNWRGSATADMVAKPIH